MLQLLGTVNDWFAARRRQHLIDPIRLTVDAVSDLPVVTVVPPAHPSQPPAVVKGLLFHDLELFLGGPGSGGGGGGFFCRNSFLLRPDTKREVLRVEAQMTQHAAGQRAVQAAVSSIQQQHAMQQPRVEVGEQHTMDVAE